MRDWIRGSMMTLIGGLLLVGGVACGFMGGTQPSPPPTQDVPAPDPKPSPDAGADTVDRQQQAKQDVVRQFLKRARRQLRRGQLDRAREALHRGLNLDPSHPGLWYELARVRERQGQYTKAETLAFRSLELANPASELHRKNWRLIARAREQLGDRAGAREARVQANRAR